jgi:hypothetical protein
VTRDIGASDLGTQGMALAHSEGNHQELATMLYHHAVIGLVAVAVPACSGEDSLREVSAADDSATVTEQRWRRPAPSENGGSGGTTTETRVTSDGEIIRVIVPELAPTQEVPPGGTCGVFNDQGVLLTCQPGSYCLSPADGVPGTCQAAPSAPRWEG